MATRSYLASDATIAGTAFPEVRRVSVSRTAQEIDTRSDGQIFQVATALQNIREQIIIEGRDIGQLIAVGATGATNVVAIKHTGGITLAGTLTIAAALSTVVSVDKGTDINGEPTITVTVNVNSADGVTSGLVETSV
jgi:hypothetical protein